MSTANLYRTLSKRFLQDPTRPFLRTAERVQTYGEIAATSERFAGALREMGLEPGDRAVVQIDKSADALALYLACLRAGVVYVPLNTAYTHRELEFYLEDAEPRLLVCRPEDEPALRERAAARGVAHVRSLGAERDGTLAALAASASPNDDVVDSDGTDMAAMLYTSGTTGKPKGAMLTHACLAANARGLHQVWAWHDDDVLLHALPIFHVHGLFVALHVAMLGASEVLYLPRFDAAAVRAELPRATVLMGVPTFYNRLLEMDGLDEAECAHMRLFISGSAPLPDTVFEAFRARTGHHVLERYGMTESGIITSNPVDGARVAGTVGFPLPDVEVRVVDDEGSPRAAGEPGGVEIRSTSLFAGYWRRPEKTREEFRDDGFFRTGDVGTLDEAGRLALMGRKTDMIISGGLNVYPKEIELCLDECSGVAESAVVGVPHPDFGEAVVAFLVQDGPQRPTDEALRRSLEEELARFKHPKRLIWLDALPRNAMGKVQKAALRAENQGLFPATR